MRKYCLTGVIAALLFSAACGTTSTLPSPSFPPPPPTVVPRVTPTLVAGIIVFGGSGTQYTPQTDGSTVVWANPAGNQIFAARLQDRQPFPVVTHPGVRSDPDISGDFIVWNEQNLAAPCGPVPPGTLILNCPGDIRGKNLAIGEELTIAATAASEWGAAISSPWAVWMSSQIVSLPDGGKTIMTTLMARDLCTQAEPISLYQSQNRLGSPVIDGDRIVWVEEFSGESGRAHVRLLMQQIGAPSPSVIVEGEEIFPFGYDIGGDLVIYTSGTQDTIRVVNIRTGWTRTIANAISPTTDGRYIFWVERWPFQESMLWARSDLWGYDTVTDVTIPVMVDMGSNEQPKTRAGVLVWWRDYLRDDGQFEEDVYAVTADLLFGESGTGQHPGP